MKTKVTESIGNSFSYQELSRSKILSYFYFLKLLSSFFTIDLVIHGTPRYGKMVLHDGEGNSLYGQWDSTHLILLEWDHDSDNALDEKALPPELMPMIKEGIFELAEPAVTSAIWILKEEVFGSTGWPQMRKSSLGIFLEAAKELTRRRAVKISRLYNERKDLEKLVLDFVLSEIEKSDLKFFNSNKQEIIKNSKIPENLITLPTLEGADTFVLLKDINLNISGSNILINLSHDSLLEVLAIEYDERVFLIQVRQEKPPKYLWGLQFDTSCKPQKPTHFKLSFDQSLTICQIKSSDGNWLQLDYPEEIISTPKEGDLEYTLASLQNIFPMFTWGINHTN